MAGNGTGTSVQCDLNKLSGLIARHRQSYTTHSLREGLDVSIKLIVSKRILLHVLPIASVQHYHLYVRRPVDLLQLSALVQFQVCTFPSKHKCNSGKSSSLLSGSLNQLNGDITSQTEIPVIADTYGYRARGVSSTLSL